MENRSSIIDNWSLEKSAILIEDDSIRISENNFSDYLGCLSNYINSLMLYDTTSYFSNGFDSDWKKFDKFYRISNVFIKPISKK